MNQIVAFQLGKALIAVGLLLAALGGFLIWGSGFKWLRLGRLPGDVSVHRDGFSFYFPITTMLLVSLVLSAVLWLASALRR
jgi:hypothetical protein